MQDLKTLDIIELKALAYDSLAAIESHQRALKALNDEIFRRKTNPAPIEKDNTEATTAQ